jgi:transposase
MPKATKPYPDQFKREAVELVRVSGRPVGQIAEELGVSDQTLRNWVHADAGGQGKGSLSPDEKEELKLLRKENKRLRMEREILKKAALGSTRQRNTCSRV